ncbi:MAG: nucleotidyltransferase family protein [Elusimicrobia bacterium]|nr:nucleotidyltransferase family protein [Elusimicrobiota bacterium]
MTDESEKILKTLRDHREEILEVGEVYGARNVRVFGSVARGEAGPNSDVDFLIDLTVGRTLFDLVDLEDRWAQIIHRPVDVVTERGMSRHMKPRVLAEAVNL